MEPLSETEMNEVDRRILRAERLGVHVTLSPRAARGLFEMAKRPTADDETERLRGELDDRNTELAVAEVECQHMTDLLAYFARMGVIRKTDAGYELAKAATLDT